MSKEKDKPSVEINGVKSVEISKDFVKSKETHKLTVVQDGKESEKIVNKPTPEEVLQFKDDFEKAMEAFKATKWEISEKGPFGSNDVGMFILDFMDRFALWTKTGWMGMIKMNEELRKAMISVDENTALQLDYQALEFLAYMLTNPGAVGTILAYEFEKIADKYSKIAIVVGEKVEEARKVIKNVQYLQEKWAAGEQGFYLSDLEPGLEKEEAGTEAKDVPATGVLEAKVIQMNPTPRE